MFSGGSVIPLPAPHDPVPNLTLDLFDKSLPCTRQLHALEADNG